MESRKGSLFGAVRVDGEVVADTYTGRWAVWGNDVFCGCL